MKVIVWSPTKSTNLRAKLHVESGLLEFEDGSISHVNFELQFNKQIKIEKQEEVVKAESSLIERSEPIEEKKKRRK